MPVDPRPIVDACEVRVDVRSRRVPVVRNVSLTIWPGEVLGLVGESGSGKTSLSLAMLGNAKPQLEIVGGEIRIDGVSMLDASPAKLRQLRGSHVSYVPQDPVASLNPALRIGFQLREILEVHGGDEGSSVHNRVAEVLAEVGLPTHREFLRRYPHQLSGGQLQRVTIAMAFACRPRAVVLDEPTTGLDVTTQARVLETIRRMCVAHGVAALYVSHDLAVVSQLADRVAVMYAGQVVEHGPTAAVLTSPAHPYTRRLVAAAPSLDDDRVLIGIPGAAPPPHARPAGCAFAPRCDDVLDVCWSVDPEDRSVDEGHRARCHRAGEASSTSSFLITRTRERRATRSTVGNQLVVEQLTAHHGSVTILHELSLEVTAGECIALVGESGSGKTTLARCIAGLHGSFGGRVVVDGVDVHPSAAHRDVQHRRAVQYVFQNPYSSLNPRRTVRELLELPIRVFEGKAAARASDDRVVDALEQVSLRADYVGRFPSQLSGGERQRVAIARALIVQPRYLVCDEVTSSLDVSVQASIVQLLSRLQVERGLGLLFVTHNLTLVRSVADAVVVLQGGRIVERGTVDDIFDRPAGAYTQRLLRDLPRLDGGRPKSRAVPGWERT